MGQYYASKEMRGWPESDGLRDDFATSTGVFGGGDSPLWADHGCIMEYLDDYSFTPQIITTGQLDLG